VLLLKNLFIPLLLIGMGQYEEARGRALDTIREWGNAGTPFSLNLLYTAYSNLAYVDMYTCVATHHYVFPAYLKKSVAYYRGSSIPPLEVAGAFAVADIRSFACLVGEGASLPEFDRFIEAAEETALYIAETSHSMYYGYDHLAACELAYYKNQPDLARSHAHSAILKAREKNQYSIEAMTEQYLLRIAVQQGDSALVNEILKQLRSHLDNPSFWSRQLLYDLITGAFYALIGLPAMAPPWLSMDEKESSSEVHIPVRELIVSVRYYIACKKFSQALNVLCKSYPREPEERFLFGELTLSLLTAVARIKTGDTPGALLDFEKAYQLSFHGIFEMFFIELGKNLRPLAAAALEQASCDIPDDWIKMIDRKASAYAKKTDSIMNSINKERNADDSMRLSDREQEVLHDLFQGLSREEIAATRYLSINTVKKTLQSIYTKLGANNNVDAVRIAIERKLVAYY
jgi:ATP/maltotriose-dependent transcriptional regulator MalT